MVRVLVRVDAHHRIGFGHAVRSAALVGTLPDSEVRVVGEAEPELSRFFPEAAIVPPMPTEAAAVRREAAAFRPDLFLCDQPARTDEIWTAARWRPDLLCAAIDDWGGRLDADLIVNGTVLDEYHLYEELRPGARVLAGPRHSLLRPDFARHSWRGGSKDVAIVAGSGDQASAWTLMLASGAVDMRDWGRVTMVVGGAHPQFDELARACGARGIELRQNLGAAALAELLSSAAVALVTGGMIVYECLAVGVPAVIFPQLQNLVAEAAWFAAHGGVVDLGFDGGVSPSMVAAAVGGLLADRSRRAALSTAGRRLVDGRGIERAAAAIQAAMAERNAARAADRAVP